jgi:hypothetical protein
LCPPETSEKYAPEYIAADCCQERFSSTYLLGRYAGI